MYSNENISDRTIVPTLRYRDVAGAIAWLSNAFGFATRALVNEADGSVRYAELTFGDGMIMLGPVEDAAARRAATEAEQAGAAETQTCYVLVDDPAEHRAKAVAAGAEIVLEIEDERSGRGYSCRDPEGHIWYFGTYDPRRRQPDSLRASARLARSVGGAVRRLALGIGFLVMTFGAAVAVAWALPFADPRPVAADIGPGAEQASRAQVAERGGGEAAERALQELRGQLQKERAARESAEKAARAGAEQLIQAERNRGRPEVQEQLARDRAAVEAAQRALQDARDQLASAERAREELRRRLEGEHATRTVAERVGKEAGEQLAKERAVKESLERGNRELREHLARERRHALRWRRLASSGYIWQ
jgi:uncharacterized glyoxalase superfamily protein PhnB